MSNNNHTKLIVVKLDDESSPLMKQYTVPDEKTDDFEYVNNSNRNNVLQSRLAPLPDFIKEKEDQNKNIQPFIPANFDELSFAMEKKKDVPITQYIQQSQMVPIRPSPVDTTSVKIKEKENFSVLAASKEVDMNKRVTIQDTPQTIVLPPINYKSESYGLNQRQNVEQRVMSLPKQFKPFKNVAEDGYKIGFMPKVDVKKENVPRNPRSLPKLETLLGIKATIVGNRR